VLVLQLVEEVLGFVNLDANVAACETTYSEIRYRRVQVSGRFDAFLPPPVMHIHYGESVEYLLTKLIKAVIKR